ncbi:MAG: hypothetical protein ACRDRT_17865, partial [Pseudonocardiaceae bacterium]
MNDLEELEGELASKLGRYTQGVHSGEGWGTIQARIVRRQRHRTHRHLVSAVAVVAVAAFGLASVVALSGANRRTMVSADGRQSQADQKRVPASSSPLPRLVLNPPGFDLNSVFD